MKPWRVTIGGLMLGVAVLAGVFATWRSMPLTFPKVVPAIALATVLVAGVGAAVSRGRRRAAWVGYACLSGTYLALALGPWAETMDEILPTAPLSGLVYDRLSYTPSYSDEEGWVRDGLFGGSYRYTRYPEKFLHLGPGAFRPFSPEAMHQIGHAVGAMILGLMGAILFSIVASHRERTRSERAIGVDRPIDAGL